MEAQNRYMKSDPAQLLSVSRAALSLLKNPAPDERIDGEFARASPVSGEEVLPSDVIGVPNGAF
jgi:hypothetical protein